MKKILLACSLLGAMSGVFAQPAPATGPSHSAVDAARIHEHEHAPDPAAQAAHLQKALQLSDEQTVKVKKVLEDNAQQRKALTDKYKPQFEAFHADLKKLHDQAHTQLNGILTPKQQQAFEAQHKWRGEHPRDGRGFDGDNHEHH